MDCSDLVKGHLELREKVGSILKRVKEGQEGEGQKMSESKE